MALGLFFYIFFWWQPLEKGIWRIETALAVFFIFFLVATLGKGNLKN